MFSLVKRLVVFALLLCSSRGVFAQESATLFLIEQIEVRGVRFTSKSVIERETLLTEGNSYSEANLRDAMNRINRLPFVLDSNFSLEKGSTRGAYILLITITETKPLFVDAQSMVMYNDDLRRNRQAAESVRSGIRYFLGSSSLVHVATDFHENYEAGLTQYNLFGRAGFASVRVRWTENEIDATFPDRLGGGELRITGKSGPTIELRGGVPVTGNHSIEAHVERTSYKTRQVAPEYSLQQEGSTTSALLGWLYDTTDDPVLPTRGTLWRTATHTWIAEDEVEVTGEVPFAPGGRAESIQYFTQVERYVPITSGQSLIGGLGYGLSKNEFGFDNEDPSDTELRGGSGTVGFTTTLWPQRFTARFGDLRLETRYSKAFGKQANNYHTATATILQRNVWGTLRFAVSYSDSGDDAGWD